MNPETETTEFRAFPKIPRLRRNIIITEKIDGTNAHVALLPETLADGTLMPNPYRLDWFSGPDASCWGLYAGSRSRWLTPEHDNYGFAAWASEHKDELRVLGPGRHFGEWWGRGINRGYGLTERRFSLFNVSRWNRELWEANESARLLLEGLRWQRATEKGKVYPLPVPRKFQPAPACCHVVPVLETGPFSSGLVEEVIFALDYDGSSARPGFMQPEGIVVFHVAGGYLFKQTIENDSTPKTES